MPAKKKLSVACLIDEDIAAQIARSDALGHPVDWPRATQHERIRVSHDLSVLQALRRIYPTVHLVNTAHRAINTLAQLRPNVVFNLALSAHPLEASFAGCLDLLGVPYTGSGPLGIALSRDKIRSRQILRSAGIRVPDFVELTPGHSTAIDLEPPVIVKPASLSSSAGIYADSVASKRGDVARLAKRIWDRFGVTAVCEEFIVGREFRFGMVETARGVHMTGISEYRFGEGGWGFRTAAIRASRKVARAHDVSRKVMSLSAAKSRDFAEIGRRAMAALDVRGYATIDLRMNAAGEGVVLEVNANPGVWIESSMWSNPSFDLNIRRMVEAAFLKNLA